ncbi:MAG TPA: ABC transporter ATP-binding protein, partial [Hyphomonas atlantica]|nr:ABC transporter ATP-binding protein [Hyphomonas atlantica]
GGLVAVIAAYKDFSAPLSELFRYYQSREDVKIRYEGVDEFLGTRPMPH